jgi:hypothetical protein
MTTATTGRYTPGTSRAIWRLAYSQSRRQLRPSPRFTVGSRFPWLMDAIRARFGASGYAVAQQAARLAFDRCTLGRGTAGTVAHLAREGLVDHAGRPTRAATVETFLDGLIAWSHDCLVDLQGRRADRAYRVRQRREIALGLAADRAAFHRQDRFAITPAGRHALREAALASAAGGPAS